MTDRTWIVDRVGSTAFDSLATGLAGSDLHSVLLEVMRTRDPRIREPATREGCSHASGTPLLFGWAALSDLGHRTGRFRGPAVDGGAFDWLAKLAANRRAVDIATGTGAQLIAGRFRTDGSEEAAG